MSDQKIQAINQKLKIVKNFALILGLPVLIGIGVYLYERQIEIYKTEINFLKQTQYNHVISLIDSQKKLFELEKNDLLKKISELKKNHFSNLEELKKLQVEFDTTKRLNDILFAQLIATASAVAPDKHTAHSLALSLVRLKILGKVDLSVVDSIEMAKNGEFVNKQKQSTGKKIDELKIKIIDEKINKLDDGRFRVIIKAKYESGGI